MTDSTIRSLRGRSFAETRSGVVDLIRTSGSITRVELSRQAGLTEGTISKIVKDLLADGVVVEAGQAESTGGKRATFLRLGDSGRWALGVTLDRGRVVVMLCALDGSRVGSLELAGMEHGDAADVLERIAAGVRALTAEHGIPLEAVMGLGVALSGRRRDQVDGTLPPQETWWEWLAVDEILADLTGLPVLLGNDADCAALGEFWSRRVPAGKDFALVYMADGIGLGVMIGGDVYRGSTGHAGEIGHIFVDPDRTPCWCGSRGCLENVGTPTAVARRAIAAADHADELGIHPDDPDRVVYGKVGAGFAAGNAFARRLLADAAGYLTTAVVGLANTLDIGHIVLAGPGFAAAPELFLSTVRAGLRRTYVSTIHPVAVELSGLDQEIAALGAASLVLHRGLTPHHVAE
jgi:predicted NBD/HSP70 family sugar kinase